MIITKMLEGTKLSEIQMSSPMEISEDQPFKQTVGIAVGLLLTLGGIPISISSFFMGISSSTGPGPGLLPLIAGLCLVVLGAFYTLGQFRELQEITRANPQSGSFIQTLKKSTPKGIARSGAVILSLIVLALVIEYLGFQISMLLFLFFHLKIMGKQSWLLSIILSVGGGFGIFAIFRNIFQVGLPTSSIEILRMIGL
ncbi:MAG: tripartite tricarboxylate transporter TctB family protein [Microbacteriaceae bacterium]